MPQNKKLESPARLEDLLEVTREVAAKVVAPLADEVDKKAKWPEKQIRALQEAGLGGLVLPTGVGGHGQGLLAMAKVGEILGKECASTAMCFGMHLVGSAVLAAKATPQQEESFLIPIAQGKHLTTLSLSEPGTGANFYIPQAQLAKKGDASFILNGKKSFVTNGRHADSYVVSTVIPDPEAPIGQFSCVVVSKETKGLNWLNSWEGLGMKGNSSCDLEFKDADIPSQNLLGQQGDQIWYVFEVVAPFFLTAMAGTYLGVASSALNEATEHLKKRSHSHSGASLAHNSVLQNRLGYLWAQVESARQLLYSGAAKADAEKEGAVLSLLSAKANVSDCVTEVVNEAMTLMGGVGYGKSSKLSRNLRDARASHVMAPTTDMLRSWTGRSLLGLPLLGD